MAWHRRRGPRIACCTRRPRRSLGRRYQTGAGFGAEVAGAQSTRRLAFDLGALGAVLVAALGDTSTVARITRAVAAPDLSPGRHGGTLRAWNGAAEWAGATAGATAGAVTCHEVVVIEQDQTTTIQGRECQPLSICCTRGGTFEQTGARQPRSILFDLVASVAIRLFRRRQQTPDSQAKRSNHGRV
jgi:hypothetical protein